MTKLSRFVRKPGSIPPLIIEESQFLRPNWTAIVEHMIATRQDVWLTSLEAGQGSAAGLYKAVRRAGYWVHTHRVTDHDAVYRLCDRPAEGRPAPKNTLLEDYAPAVPPRGYGRYRV